MIDSQGRRICGSRLRKKPGKFCQRYLGLGANGRCRLHGGKAPRGPMAKGFRTGRYSKYLRKGLIENYEAAQRDPDLLNLTAEIHLIDANTMKLLEAMPEGGTAKAWEAAKDEFEKLRGFYDRQEWAAMGGPMAALIDALSRGSKDAAVEADLRRQLFETLDLRKRVVEAEVKRKQLAGRMLSAEEVTGMFLGLAASIRAIVSDPGTLNRIQAEMRLLWLGAGSDGLPRGGPITDEPN